MIEICGKIEITSSKNVEIGAKENFVGNNISAPIESTLNKKSVNSNPFIIGSSILGDGSTFSDGEDFFISSEKSGEDGNFPKTYTFELISENTKFNNLTVRFDTHNKRHPQTITIDGNEYFDNDSIFSVFNLENKASHIISISNWNTPNYPLVISGIYSGSIIEINRRNLISFNRQITDRADMNLPSFGIISNNGSISIKDEDGEISDYIEFGIMKDSELNLSVKNSITKSEQRICKLICKEIDYDNDNRSVNISLKDELEEWQNINIQPMDYSPDITNETDIGKPFKEIYQYLWVRTNENGFLNMIEFRHLDEKTKNILTNTYIKYPMLEQGNLWAQWQKLCEACQLHIYKNSDGTIVCRYNGGN